MSERKSVIVTGAASGIGRAAAQRLAGNGWNVVAVDRDEAKLGWTDGVDHVVGVVADVSSEADNLRMVAVAEAQFGRLDALICNAGIGGFGAIDTLPFADFERVVAVNLFGAVHGIRAALPLLRGQKQAAIVVTSSALGVGADADNWAYCSSKHALVGLVRSLSRELGWEGIRVNAVCPGGTAGTGFTAGLEASPERLAALARGVPLQRFANPDEIAAVMEFLVSPASSYVNGLALVADGGAINGTGLMPPKAGDWA